MINLLSPTWKIENIDTIFFDKDGTFIDSHVYWGEIIQRRILAAIHKYHLPEQDFVKLCHDMGFDYYNKKLLEKGPVGIASRAEVISCFIQSIQKRYDIIIPFEEMDILFKEVHDDFKKYSDDYIVPIDSCINFMDRIKRQNVCMAVITSDAYEMTHHILQMLNLNRYFDLIITKDDTIEAKSTGVPALKALQKLGAKADRTISVGDAQMDSLMAQASGLKGALLTASGQISVKSLKKYSPYVVEDMSYIESIIS